MRELTPGAYARALLASIGHGETPLPIEDERGAASLWAASGAMQLTGHADGEPRHCAAPLAACAQGAWLALAALVPQRFDPGFDAYRLLGERAAIAGLRRRGRLSAGGACRLVQTGDGWLALNLARAADAELLPAWLEHPVDGDEALEQAVLERDTRTLVGRARLLGLAAAPLARPRAPVGWYRETRLAPPVIRRRSVPLVIELGALWAAPLCGQLLRQAGARVIKVESCSRPDGARAGPPAFFDLLNAGKESVALDLRGAAGRASLRELLLAADIVIESSRPRALEQMGLHARQFVAARPGMSWLGISGYGRRAPMRHWTAYGDDAGVAAGLSWLVGECGRDPVFCGDAIADPLTGLHAALLAWSAFRAGGGQLLDLSLRGVIAHAIAAGTASVPVADATPPAEPYARPVTQRAAVLGVDTARVLREFGRGGPE